MLSISAMCISYVNEQVQRCTIQLQLQHELSDHAIYRANIISILLKPTEKTSKKHKRKFDILLNLPTNSCVYVEPMAHNVMIANTIASSY